jgi:NAD(P)-dependent dehydrogenase (short-subunit alcohol dehydrogenase family)
MDAVGTPSSVLVVGGTSDIGLAVVERLGTGARLRVVLAARPSPRRDAAVQRLTGAGHQATVVDFDAEDTASHATTVEQAFAGGDLDVSVVAVGLLGDQEQAWQDAAAAVRLLQVNATAAVSTGVLVAERLRRQGPRHRRRPVVGGRRARAGARTSSTAPARRRWTPSTPACARRCAPTASGSSSSGPASCARA